MLSVLHIYLFTQQKTKSVFVSSWHAQTSVTHTKLVKQRGTAQLEDGLHTRQDSQFPTHMLHYISSMYFIKVLFAHRVSCHLNDVHLCDTVDVPRARMSLQRTSLLTTSYRYLSFLQPLTALNSCLFIDLHALSETCTYQVQSHHFPGFPSPMISMGSLLIPPSSASIIA